VSFPKLHYYDLLPTVVADLLAVSLTTPQQVGNFPVYQEVTGKRVLWIWGIITGGLVG